MIYIFGWPEIRNCIIFGWPRIQNCDIISFWSVWQMGGLRPKFCRYDKKKMKKRFKVVICRKFEIFSAKSDSLLSNFDI